jgi:hypothetical protein
VQDIDNERVLGLKSKLPSSPADVTGLKNRASTHAYRIPLVISSESQFNTDTEQALKFGVDLMHFQVFKNIIMMRGRDGGGGGGWVFYIN